MESIQYRLFSCDKCGCIHSIQTNHKGKVYSQKCQNWPCTAGCGDYTSMSHDFNSLLRVTNLENGKSIICRVNDRGGFKKYGRILDLSKGAFSKIANLKQGIIKVNIEVVK